MVDLDWNFPGNGNGQIRGYSDAGIELWNAEDKAKVIFEEAGYDMTDGSWEYEC